MIRALLVGLLVMWALLAGDIRPVAAQDATPEPGIGGPVDPRSDGEGPGLDADPLVVFVGVVLLGLVTAGATLLVVRVLRDD